MRYRLVHLTGSLAGRVRDVDAAELVLGRDPTQAQVVFGADDRQVSRRHALIEERDGTLLLRDLDSTTGTFLDGEDIEEAELVHGDVFELGRGGPRVRVDLEGEAAEGGTLVIATPAAVTLPPMPVAERRPPAPGLRGPAPGLRGPAPGLRGSAATGPGTKLRLTFLAGARSGTTVEAGGALIRLGRAQGSTVCTPEDRMVSAQHAKIVRLEDGYVLMDLDSTNGTYLNGQRVERASLAEGDVVTLGAGGPQLQVAFLAPDVAAATVSIPNFPQLAARRALSLLFVRDVPLPAEALRIGRAETADLRLDSPIVSKAHAQLVRQDGLLRVLDLGSTNGTYLNGQRVESAPAAPGDRIVIGPFELEVGAIALRVLDTRNRVRVDARELRVQAGARLLLDGVSLALPPGSFTALIGPSGAGKSTLLMALAGVRRAHGGQVLLNGADLYAHFERLKASLGYVPQDDIVHRELTVFQSLDYTARLRLPEDTSPEERAKRIAEVLATLELSERRDIPIQRLSGGQRKRVSIATELLTEPNLIFLDEPTSGLDPGLEEALMLLLRELSYKGKTVVLVTHTLDNIHLCDGLVLLVEGRLAFYGGPGKAREHFGIDHMVNLYGRLKEKPPERWREEFRASDLHRTAVAEPLAALPPPAAPPKSPERRGPGALRQLAVLTSRYFATINRDTRNAVLLVAQAPLIAGLIGLSLLYGESDVAYTKPKNTILFLLALTAIWFGCSNAARELVKERAIYLRERMVNLRILPYVLSKVVVLGGLAAVQCVLFLIILEVWFGIPGRPELLFAAMLAASGVGILLGLCLSALVTSADRAMTLLPIILIPQVLFTSPAVQMDMKGPAGLVARGMPTWWAYDLMRRVALAPGDALDDDGIEAGLKQDRHTLLTKARLQGMLNQGYLLNQYRSKIEMTWTASLPDALAEALPERLGASRPAAVDLLALAGFGALLLASTLLLQKRYDRQS